mgnify:FL=1
MSGRKGGIEELAMDLTAAGIPFEREYRFAGPRKLRADFYVRPDLLIEVEGGSWSGGRHVSGVGYRNDCEKYNAAVLLGWRVLRFTADMVRDGCLETIEDALQVAIPALETVRSGRRERTMSDRTAR